ncbi:MAG: Gfo/Idh/MocA family oxidoreductase [Treponema sp.]|nr:Gfo/Idh/MocA family oxidoreductase [Treponema sp.]
MENTTYTAALVGCGRIGYSLGLDKKREQPASHTMALTENSRITLVAGCDTDSERRSAWHTANKTAAVYSSSSDMYAHHSPDIITVAVNENAHLAEALAAIAAKPRLVILEKPVALDTIEAFRIQDAAARAKIPVLVNHERRFADDYRAARSYLPQIGNLQSIHASLHSSLCVYNPQEERSGAYSLIHDGTHLVDIVLFFLEAKADSETAISTETTKSVLHGHPVLTGLFRDEKKLVRQVTAHYSSEQCPDIAFTMSGRSRFFGFDIDIYGTEGRICIGNGYCKLYHREASRLYTGFYSLMCDKTATIPKKTRYFSNMVQNAVDFLDGNAPLGSTLQNGINALTVLEEIKRGF